MFDHFAPQILLAMLGAFLIGVSKTGVAGIGILSVVIFAIAFPAKGSVGIVLPILLCADLVAVTSYRRHAVWSHLWRLLPWAGIGIIIGYLAMGKIDDVSVARLIGGLAIGLSCMQVWRRNLVAKYPEKADAVPHQLWFAATMGILGGFTTMVANAAGPIMVLYLLAASLPKMEFMGTSAWFFFIVNSVKVPLLMNLGLINLQSLPVDLILAPFAVLGAFTGRPILKRIKQSAFENLALILTVIAGLKLALTGILPAVK
jgi:hypothetical protein